MYDILDPPNFQRDPWNIGNCSLQVVCCREFGIQVSRELPATKVSLGSKSEYHGAWIFAVIANVGIRKTLYQDGRKRRIAH